MEMQCPKKIQVTFVDRSERWKFFSTPSLPLCISPLTLTSPSSNVPSSLSTSNSLVQNSFSCYACLEMNNPAHSTLLDHQLCLCSQSYILPCLSFPTTYWVQLAFYKGMVNDLTTTAECLPVYQRLGCLSSEWGTSGKDFAWGFWWWWGELWMLGSIRLQYKIRQSDSLLISTKGT